MGKVSKRLLLGILGAATSFGMMLGGKAVVDSVDNGATEVAAATGDTYVRVDSLNDFDPNSRFILATGEIGSNSKKFVFDPSAAADSTDNGVAYSEAITNGVISDDDGSLDKYQFTFETKNSGGKTTYLIFGSSNYVGKNSSKTKLSSNANELDFLEVSFASNHNFRYGGDSSFLRYNGSSNKFRYYGTSSSGMYDVCLYKFNAGITADPESVAISLNGNLIEDSLTVYDGQCVNFEASVLPEGADQDVTWSEYMSDDGSVLFIDGELITEGRLNQDESFSLTVSSADGSVSKTIGIHVVSDWVEKFVFEGTVNEQVVGKPFDFEGLAFFGINDDFKFEVTDLVTFSPDVITVDTTEVIASFKNVQVSIPVDIKVSIEDEVVPTDFKNKTTSGYETFSNVIPSSGSGASYGGHFYMQISSSASSTYFQLSKDSKNGSKTGLFNETAPEGFVIQSIEIVPNSTTSFNIHWSAQPLTIAKLSSNDTYYSVKSADLSAGKNYVYDFNDPVSYFGINTTSGTAQIRSIKIIWVPENIFLINQANGWAKEMMDSGICDSGVADSETWEILELYYDELSIKAKQLLQTYEADVSESASVLAQALYRYDYILDIYGTDKFNDYIGRGGTPSGAYSINRNGDDNLWAIAGLGLVGFVSAAALLVLRKKKRA